MHLPIDLGHQKLYFIVLRLEKKKYSAACLACCASFTPLCFSVDGLLGTEAGFFLCRLADRLSSKWEMPYSLVMGWVQARLLFAVLVICV